MTERTIFMAAVETADATERAKFLDARCAGDPALRQQVETLLAAHERSGQFLDCPALAFMDEAASDSVVGDTQVVPGREQVAKGALPFLAASTKQGSLGRLGHYEILEIVGKGGMGVVLRAFDEKLHRVVAIKVLAQHLSDDPTARQRFVREARAAAAVSHENVIAIHAVEDAGPVPYIVMHFVSGQTLQQKLDRAGPPPLKEVLRIGLQIGDGLAAAHKQGLIHRDIKPANILLENGIERVRITDFGLARAATDDASLTQSGMIAGTPQYMSPEQAECKPVDQRSDLFSLGGVLYALCTGHAPFRGPSTIAVLKRVCEEAPPPIRELNPDVPIWLEAIVAKLHAKAPDQRFQTAAEVAQLLARHLAQLQRSEASAVGVQEGLTRTHAPAAPSVVPRQPDRIPLAQPLSPARLRRGLIAAALLLALVMATGIWFLMPPRSSAPTSVAHVQPPPTRPLTLEERAQLPSPLDGATRETIPGGLLALAGGSDAPAELVAILGDNQIRAQGEAVLALECSPDGKLLAVSRGRKVLLYEIATGKLFRTFDLATDEPHRPAFSSDTTRVLVATGQTIMDGSVQLWDIASGNRLRNFVGHRMGVLSCTFGPKDETVITGGVDSTVRVWETETGKQKFVLPHNGHIHGMIASPDGQSLLTACNDGVVRVWDLENGALRKMFHRHTGGAFTLFFSPNGRFLASSGDREGIVWDAATFDVVQTIPQAGWTCFVDDATLITSPAAYGDTVQHFARRWDIKTGKKLSEFALAGRGGYSAHTLSPDGKVFFNIQTFSGNALVLAYDSETGKRLVPSQEHEGPVRCVAVSPDGLTLASGGADHTVRLWDLKTRKLLHVLRSHSLDVTSLAFSPDGQLLASGSLDTTIELWDVAHGDALTTLTGHARTDSMIAFSPDGQTVAAGSDNGEVKFWDVAGGKPKSSMHWHTGAVRAVAFSPDGKQLVSTSADKKVQVVDLVTGRVLHTFAIGEGSRLAQFSADGRSVAAACDTPNGVHVWDLETEKERVFSGPTGSITGLALSPVSGLIAASSQDGTIRFWEPNSGCTRLLSFGPTGLRQVAFTPEGRYLAVGQDNGTISILRVPANPPKVPPGSPLKLPDSLELAKRPTGADGLDRKAMPPELLPEHAPAELVGMLGDARLQHQGPIVAMRFIDNEKGIVSMGKDNTVRYWDAANGGQQRLVRINTAPFSGCALSPDGNMLALGYDNQAAMVKLWDLTTGKETHQLNNAADRGVLYPGIAFTPDGKKLVTGGRWYWSKLWDPTTGAELRRLEHHGCNVFSYAFNPDGTTLASVNEDGEVILWNVENGEQRRKLIGHGKSVATVSFAWDGQSVVSGDWAGTAKRWDVATGKEMATFVGHTGGVRSILMTPDGQTVITGGADKTIRLWDAATGKERLILGRHLDSVDCLALTADGKTLASAGGDGTIRLWNMETQKERLPRQGHEGRITAVAVSPDGKRIATSSEDRTVKLWDLGTLKLLQTLTGHEGAVQSIAFSPDGKVVVSQSADELRLWDAATGKPLRSINTRSDTPGVVFSPDSRWFATTGTAGAILLWEASSGKVSRRLSGHRAGLVRMAFSPDGKFLASVGPDGARLWDVAAGWQVSHLPGPVRPYTTVAFSPDGQALALGSPGRTELRDAWTGKERAVFPGEQLAFRADGLLLATSGTDGKVTFWEPRAGPGFKMSRFSTGRQRISQMALTPEGRYLITASGDGTVQVLRLAKPGEVFHVAEKDTEE